METIKKTTDLGELTPEQWLQLNYMLITGDEVTIFSTKALKRIAKIKKTDNKGHYRTNYPVVVGFEPEDAILKSTFNWYTLEEIFGY